MKNSVDLGGCYPPRPSASVANTLLDLQNSSYPTRPHLIIANYSNNNAYITNISLSIVVHVLQIKQKLVISDCCFAEDKEMYPRTITHMYSHFSSYQIVRLAKFPLPSPSWFT